MQITRPVLTTGSLSRPPIGAVLTLAMLAMLWAPVFSTLWRTWNTDDSLSHGPLIPLIAAGHLWVRRKELGPWNAAAGAGLALLVLASLLQVGSVWADIAFLQPLSLIGMMAGTVWFLGGWNTLKGSVGALGMLVFMIPWPTTLVARLAFPLQLTSSAYAAMFAGICGLPIQREGVHLSVMPDPEGVPTYSILVAQQCSGLTSLTVLLLLAYLFAYHTPVGMGGRLLMLAAVAPLALFTNAVRLTLILLAGAHHSAELAMWVHDHEAPVLIFFCSLGLMGLRQALLSWTGKPAAPPSGGNTFAALPPAAG